LTASAATTTSGVSKAAFIASADAICKAADAALAPLGTINDSSSDTAAQRALQGASGAFTVAVNQLATLTPPPELAANWNRYVSDAKQAGPLISGMADAIGAGDAATLAKDASQAKQLTTDARQALAGLGFAHCGAGH